MISRVSCLGWNAVGAIVVGAILVGGCSSGGQPAPIVVEKPVIVEKEVAVFVGGEKVVFEDDFSMYKPTWKQVRGKWILEGGKMQQDRDDPRELNSLMYVDILDLSDVEFLAGVESGGGTGAHAGAGLVFRLQDENNYYMFRLAGQSAVLGYMKDGQWTDLANPQVSDFRVTGNLDYSEILRIKVRGNRIQCWVSEDSVVNLVDDTFTTGKFGLVTFKSTAAFDWVKMIELE